MKKAAGVLGALLAALGIFSLAGSVAGAQSTASKDRFALLPPVAGDTGLPYAIFPSPAERVALGNRLRALLEQRGAEAADPTRVEHVIARDGFDQNSPRQSCDDAEC